MKAITIPDGTFYVTSDVLATVTGFAHAIFKFSLSVAGSRVIPKKATIIPYAELMLPVSVME